MLLYEATTKKLFDISCFLKKSLNVFANFFFRISIVSNKYRYLLSIYCQFEKIKIKEK